MKVMFFTYITNHAILKNGYNKQVSIMNMTNDEEIVIRTKEFEMGLDVVFGNSGTFEILASEVK